MSLLGWAQIQNDCCPHEKKRQRLTGGRTPRETGSEQSATAAIQGTPGLPANPKRLEEAGRILPCKFQREHGPAYTLI